MDCCTNKHSGALLRNRARRPNKHVKVDRFSHLGGFSTSCAYIQLTHKSQLNVYMQVFPEKAVDCQRLLVLSHQEVIFE